MGTNDDTWRQGAARVRDARNVREPEKASVGGLRKKNTKRWCKGKVGREHKPECIIPNGRTPSDDTRVLACMACGKELERYWTWKVWVPPRGREPGYWKELGCKEKPAWVDK